MTVYVESNFVLELALQQEQELWADSIVAKAEQGVLRLCVPIIALCEPISTIQQRTRGRKRTWSELQRHIEDLSRSVAHSDVLLELHPVQTAFSKVDRIETSHMLLVLDRLLKIVLQAPLTLEVLADGHRCQTDFGLAPADALIYASVVADLRRQDYDEEKVFVTRNTKDFDHPGIEKELGSYRCRYYRNFEALDDYLNATLRQNSSRIGEH